jgi:PKD repeat protein
MKNPSGRAAFGRGLLAAAAGLLLASAVIGPSPAAGGTGDIGYEGQSFVGTTDPTGTKRAESLLWFNDGLWWGSMWDSVNKGFRIFRLDTSSQTWVSTGTPIDMRADTHADVLWDGSKLYVASHRFVDDEQDPQPGFPSYLYRFSYSSGTKNYTLDTGFPAQINNMKTETLVIDKDSTGTLWATWTQNRSIYVSHTLNSDDRAWGTPFPLPFAQASNLTIDDNSAILAFNGDRIGVMWSNQTSANDAMWFSVHLDSDPDTVWTAARTAIQGPNSADDHINLKTLTADNAGRVYAAVKTSFSNNAQPQIMLLVRDLSSGNWTSYPISRVADCPNRVIVLIDEENRVLHTYFTAPGPPAYSCNSSGGEIQTKTSPLDAIAFPVGTGTTVIRDADSAVVHNVTSTKQNVSSATGIAILARNSSTKRYWHAYIPIGSGPPPPTPSPTPTPTPTPTPVPTPTPSPTTTPTPTPTPTPVSPIASFVGSPTSGNAPLTVAFTDTSTGNPAAWAWSFGDGTSSTEQNPVKTYPTSGTYTVTLSVSNSVGADTATGADYVVVTDAPPSSITRETTNTVVNTTATSTISLAKPAGTAAGDVLVACLASNGSRVATTGVPTGWSEIAAILQGTSTRTFGYYKVATANEAGPYTWTLNAAVANSGGIARYSGVSSTTPLDGTPRWASGAAATSGTVPGLTTTVANDVLVGCMSIDSSSATVTITPPSGSTPFWNITGKRQAAVDGDQPVAGPTGSQNWTFSGSREWAGWLIALRPA